ncbi:isoleucyl-tRNA synthase [Parcubacteria bacterium DG_74_2]|nr:MAG: isoleucyl-tRNA synthase [Parcubacteria bacterium DG_74_2]
MEIKFPRLEEKILKFWKKNKIFEKSIENRKKSPNFVFYEGPPTVNAEAGIHHVLSRVFKDIICRYKTMQGFKVLRKAGWDTHGLPVELEIEKKLELKTKKDIEKYGVAKFNRKCKKLTDFYIKKWEKLTERIGFWLDMKDPYITHQSDYIETLWWILKEVHKKGLLYEDYKVVPYCPRCGTSLSSHEVALGYEKIKEPSVYIKFKIQPNTYLLVWTTTPWTLPGNVAIAINPNFNYIKLKLGKEILILAKERKESSNIEGEILEEFKGEKILGIEYEPLFPPQKLGEKRQIYKVLPAEFVSTEEGTGLVHIAPAFGEEDMDLIKNQNSKLKNQNLPQFPVLLTVDEEGKMITSGYEWHNLFVKDADPLIIENLKKRNILFREEIYEHDYPFCWRCHTPLLYYAKKSWFLRMSALRKKLIENNKKINWLPAYLKEGRFGEWLREIKDWALSRERYWGTPLPIWQCKKCGNFEVIGSLKELISKKFSKNNYFLFRHGHSLRQVKNIACCWPEKFYCPLTKKGKIQVKKAAQQLKNKKIDLIFSSDLLRTKKTAEILAKELGVKTIFDKRLREYDVGIFNGKISTLAWQYISKKKNPLLAKPPKGESLMKVRKRMYGFLRDIEKKYRGKKILIVSHELPLSILGGVLKGFSLEKTLSQRRLNRKNLIKTGEWRKIEFKNLPFNEKMEINFHRPFVDGMKFYCQKCENLMERIPEVIDCWFDSGAMPFAQYHYPFENKKTVEKGKQFPADFISEAIDQTRGWFYTLLAISTLAGFGAPFENVISLGHVLDEKGEKMSKSKGNVVDPWSIIEKYGVDSLRWYFYTVNQPEDSKFFSEKEIRENLRKFILTFWNCFLFFKTYGKIINKKAKVKNILDKWIISRLHQLIFNATNSLNEYNITKTARLIEYFVINDLSLWYVRRSRKRFQKPKEKEELKEVSAILFYILSELTKITAPFLPFLSEEIYQEIYGLKFQTPTSVHLEDWPETKEELINEKLNKKMERVREIVASVLAQRKEAGIKIRQPLKKLQIPERELENELSSLIKGEVNVKEISFGKNLKLDTEITLSLREEGIIREIVRNLQKMRKEAGYKPKDIILISVLATDNLKKLLLKNKENILGETKAKDLKLDKTGKFKIEKEIKIDGKNLFLAIKKVE